MSRFLVMDLPGLEKLAEEAATLRVKEGPTLNQGILSWGVLVRDLATPEVRAPLRWLVGCVARVCIYLLFPWLLPYVYSWDGVRVSLMCECVWVWEQKADFAVYDSSLLTKLLRDALGGNCRTLAIAQLAPSSPFRGLTLKYGRL